MPDWTPAPGPACCPAHTGAPAVVLDCPPCLALFDATQPAVHRRYYDRVRWNSGRRVRHADPTRPTGRLR